MFKKKIIIICIVLIVVFIIFIIKYSIFQTKKLDYITTQQIENEILPYIVQNKITLYKDTNWCSAIKYNGYSKSRVINNSNLNSCLEYSTPFNETDRKFFDEFKEKMLYSTNKKLILVDTEYDTKHNAIGLAFYIKCSFCNTRYVFWPKYNKLPSNIEREIQYTPINVNWYKIEQDWN
jgi:hypothetical protein